MRWVTRDHLHLDRVACPWLIRRFIDHDAEFIFVEWGREDSRPEDAIPFAIPDVELGVADGKESTFDKIMSKYRLNDPALIFMARVLGSGIHRSLHKGMADEYQVPLLEGIGLESISQGMMLTTDGDLDNLDKSMSIYDALYAYCSVHVAKSDDLSIADKSIWDMGTLMKPKIKEALCGKVDLFRISSE